MQHLSLKALHNYIKRLSAGVAVEASASGLVFFVMGIILGFLPACTPAKKTTYFQDITTDTVIRTVIEKNVNDTIKNGDVLSISVTSLSPDNMLYNAPPNSSGDLTGYLVDESGNIDFYKLGKVNAAGMTIKELRTKLEQALVPYIREAIVGAGFVNRHVTLMGGIGPQVLNYNEGGLTILDALASSGDIGERGKKENVLLIRKNGDSTLFKRLDLTSRAIFQSPYFYLQPNDIVYVEPVKDKAKTAQIVSYVTAGVSFLFLILNNVLKL